MIRLTDGKKVGTWEIGQDLPDYWKESLSLSMELSGDEVGYIIDVLREREPGKRIAELEFRLKNVIEYNDNLLKQLQQKESNNICSSLASEWERQGGKDEKIEEMGHEMYEQEIIIKGLIKRMAQLLNE